MAKPTLVEQYPNLKSQAQLDALTKVSLTDFKWNLKYQHAVRVGVVNTGTDNAPVFEDRFELKDKQVSINNMEADLFELRSLIGKGLAFTPTTYTTTVPATTTTTTTTVP